MHPVLVEVPWPELGVPLWPLFLLLAFGGALVAAVAFRRRERRTVALGAGLALLSLAAAFTTRASRLLAGPFELRSFGVLFAASLVVGSALALARSERRALTRELVLRASVGAAVGGVVGARVAWVLLHPTAIGNIDGVAAFYRGGLSVWGGLAGAVVALKLASRENGTSFNELADLAAPGFAAGVVLTRLGCFLEGCDFGIPLSKSAPRFLVALGTFPKNSPAFVEHVLSRGLSPSATSSLAVHPSALYEALGGAVLLAVAFLLARRKLRAGTGFLTVSLLYLTLRVSLDWLRDDLTEMWVSRTLLLLAALIGGAVAGIRYLRGRRPAGHHVRE